MMALHWIDYVILVILALSVLTGLVRGFLRELIALCVWIAAIWIGYHYAPEISPWFKSYFQDEKIRVIISFIILLLATLLIGGLFSTILSFILNRTPLKGTDRLLGIGFGLVRGIFIVSLLIGIIHLTSIAKDTEFKNAQLYTRFRPLSVWLFNLMPGLIDQVNELKAKNNDDVADSAQNNQ